MPAETISLIGYYGGLLEDFVHTRGTIEHSLYEMRQRIAEVDAVVSKSIEATEILGFYAGEGKK